MANPTTDMDWHAKVSNSAQNKRLATKGDESCTPCTSCNASVAQINNLDERVERLETLVATVVRLTFDGGAEFGAGIETRD